MALEVREAALESAPEPSSVLDAIACPVLVLSLDGTLLDLNRAAAELLGLEPAAARGKSAWDLPVPRNLRAAARDVFAPGLAGRLPVTGEAAWKERRIAWTLRAAGTAVVATGTDVTDQAAEARRLEQERDFAMQVIGALGQGVAVEGADWRLHYVNPAFARMAGRSPDEVLRSPTLALIDPADHATVLRAQERRSRNASDEYEVGVLRPDGTRLPVLVTAVPWLRDGEGVGSIAVLTDLSGRKATEAELAQRTLEAEALLEFSKMLEFQEDLESSAPAIIDVLARAVHLHAAGLAYRRDDGIEITVDWATEESKLRPGFHSRVPRGRGLTWLAFESGQPLYVDDYAAQAGASDHWLSLGLRSLAIIPIADGSLGDPVAFLAGRFAQAGPWLERERALLEAAGRSARAAIERYRRLREARRHALEDPLTSVGNRRAFDADLDAALAAAEAAGEPLSVLMVDLDNLKEMNDRFGHARGDLLLREFAGALKRSLRFDDSVYRFGGDEFAALLPRSPAAAQAAVMERLSVAVELVRAAGFPDFDVSAGVATFPEEGASGSAVVRIADQRLYQCKAEHRERRA